MAHLFEVGKPRILLNGECTRDPRLDRIRRVDLRSLRYRVGPALTADERKPRSYTWRCDTWLDQGAEGACVGFGFTHELLARPSTVRDIDATFAREHIYWAAQHDDQWPGGAYPGAEPFYEGTSVLSGARVCKTLGYIPEYRWAFNVSELALAVGYLGPAVIGVDWYEGMYDTNEFGFIAPVGQIVGGHCILVHAVRIVRDRDGRVDPVRSYFTLHNSWGPSWGDNGRARLTFVDMAVLTPGGDFCVPVKRVRAPA